MIDPYDFARKQAELVSEFAKFIVEHPEVDRSLPEDAYIFFDVAGDEAFNEYSYELALRRQREDGVQPVRVRIQGLAPPRGSRLIDPQILPLSTAA